VYLELGVRTYDRPPDPHVRGAYQSNYPRGHRVEDVTISGRPGSATTVCNVCRLPVKWISRTGGMRNGEKGYWQHERATR
jgi:hypothetical protein